MINPENIIRKGRPKKQESEYAPITAKKLENLKYKKEISSKYGVTPQRINKKAKFLLDNNIDIKYKDQIRLKKDNQYTIILKSLSKDEATAVANEYFIKDETIKEDNSNVNNIKHRFFIENQINFSLYRQKSTLIL